MVTTYFASFLHNFKQLKITFSSLNICLFISISIINSSFSQGIKPERLTFQDPKWNVKVKQLEDFMDRFNNEVKYFQNDELFSYTLEKNDYKKLLINLIEIDSGAIYEEFLEKVSDDLTRSKISFYDKNWHAEVEVKFSYNGESYVIPLILEVTEDQKIGHKWVISSANQPDKDLLIINNNPEVFINPTNHNLRFSKMQYYLNGDNQFGGLFSEKLPIDHLTIFIFLLSRNEIEILGIQKVKYHFLQYPDFIFTVENFERSNDKSGWLISHIIKASDSEKSYYLTKTLNISDHETKF